MPGKATHPSAIVVPFGKHKGKTVAELLASDPSYADWVLGQGWVAERFAELHAALVSRGAGADDTPEHNALQARFLDHAFCLSTLKIIARDAVDQARSAIIANRRHQLNTEIKSNEERIHAHSPSWMPKGYPDWREEIAAWSAKIEAARDALNEPEITEVTVNPEFEVRGVDVKLTWGARVNADAPFWWDVLAIELKPSLGDDYPTVLREMKRLDASVLIVGAYNGRGASEPQMRAIFTASGIKVVFVHEIEEAMRQG